MGVNEVKWLILRFLPIKEVEVLHRNKAVEWIGDSYTHTLWHVLVCSWPAHVLVLLYLYNVVIVNAETSLWSAYCNGDLSFTGDKADTVGTQWGPQDQKRVSGTRLEKSRNIGETPLGIKWSERISLSVLFTNTYYLRLIDTYCSLEEDLLYPRETRCLEWLLHVTTDWAASVRVYFLSRVSGHVYKSVTRRNKEIAHSDRISSISIKSIPC